MSCSSCKEKTTSNLNNLMFWIGLELLIASVYGHYEAIKKLIPFIESLF
jgi:hypothetical protein